MRLLLTNTRLRRALKASDEIHKYTDDLSEMSKLRDKALQAARLYSRDKAAPYEEEVSRYTTQIEMAQKVMMFLMAEITEDY